MYGPLRLPWRRRNGWILLGNLAYAREMKTIVNEGFYVGAFVRNDLQMVCQTFRVAGCNLTGIDSVDATLCQ